MGIFNQTEEIIEPLKTVKKIIQKALQKENLEHTECNIIIVDDNYIQLLNRTYRHLDRPTDVITFALEDDTCCQLPNNQRVLGDIYISITTAQQQALNYQHSLERELCFLAVHGFYHLLGYDHQTKEEEMKMFQKQEEVLTENGIER